MIVVKLPEGYLQLESSRGKWEWVPGADAQGDDAQALAVKADFANLLTEDYRYSPADGQPGHRLAWEVAQKLGGEAVVPPPDKAPEGLVF